MKNSDGSRYPRNLIIICVAVVIFATLPLISGARVSSARGIPSTTVNIVNNSTRAIRNVYISHVDSNDWSADQLDASLAAGQSTSISIACDAQQMKVIGEDQDGCFASFVVTCGANSTWTITNDTARDCGE